MTTEDRPNAQLKHYVEVAKGIKANEVRRQRCVYSVEVLKAYIDGQALVETSKDTGMKTTFSIGVLGSPSWDWKHNAYCILPLSHKEKLLEMLKETFDADTISKVRLLLLEVKQHVQDNF